MPDTLRHIGIPLAYLPVRHACGHFEARLTRWGSDQGAGMDKARGFLTAGSVCSTCEPQGRPVSQQFPTLESVQAHCLAETKA